MSKDGGLAFPLKYTQQYGDDAGIQYVEPGMTLRDWFAGMALSGMNIGDPEISFEKLSEWAYKQADAMIAQREKEMK
jgi:hypothetical protein